MWQLIIEIVPCSMKIISILSIWRIVFIYRCFKRGRRRWRRELTAARGGGRRWSGSSCGGFRRDLTHYTIMVEVRKSLELLEHWNDVVLSNFSANNIFALNLVYEKKRKKKDKRTSHFESRVFWLIDPNNKN